MAQLTLYLNNVATASPFPTTSKKLVTSAPSGEVQLGPGEFDSGLPGNTDCGQWNPSSPIADTTAAAEIDNTGASLGTTRQGWLYDTDLAGQVMAAGTWTVQLRLDALQGTGTTGRIFLRVTIVTGNSGAWATVANLLTTNIVGETSHSNGQLGWRAHSEAVITVTSTPANFSVTFDTSVEHTFASDERILVELGFGNGNSTADRTWALLYSTSNSFVITPDIAAGPTESSGSSAGSSTAAATGASTAESSGTAAGTSTTAATGSSTAAASGSAAGTSSATGVGASTAATSGSAAGSSAADAEGQSVLEGAGAAAGSSSASAAGESTAASSGTIAGSATATAVGGSTAASSGTSAGTATATGTGASVAEASGSAAAAASAIGTGASTAEASGSAAGTSAAVGVGDTVGGDTATGTSGGTSTAAAAGASTAGSSGTALGSSSASAGGESIFAGAGTSAGTSTAAGVSPLTIPHYNEAHSTIVGGGDTSTIAGGSAHMTVEIKEE